MKVTFFNGKALRPLPPVEAKDPEAQYYHIHEDDAFDEARLADWVRQAAALPGWKL